MNYFFTYGTKEEALEKTKKAIAGRIEALTTEGLPAPPDDDAKAGFIKIEIKQP